MPPPPKVPYRPFLKENGPTFSAKNLGQAKDQIADLWGGGSGPQNTDPTRILQGIWAENIAIRFEIAKLSRTMMSLGRSGGGGGGPGGLGGGRFARGIHAFQGLSNIARGFSYGNVGQIAMGAAQLTRAAGMGGGVGAGGAAAGGIGATAAAVAAPVIIIAAVAAFVYAMKQAADALIEHRRELAKTSGAMAAVYGQRDVREMLREKERGDRLAQSTGFLIQNEQRYKDNIFPLEVMLEELKSDFLGGMYSALADIAEDVNEIASTFGIVEKRNKSDAGIKTFSDLVNTLSDKAKAKQNEARDRARGKA